MNLKILLTTLTLLIAGVFNVNASSPAALYIRQRAEDALQEQMIKSRSTQMLRSSISSCHPYYSELLNNILANYEQNLKKCEDNENEKLETLASEGQQSRDATTETLNEVCANLDGCKAESENLEFFDCVNSSGDKNTRGVWKASKDSSDTAAHIREQIHVIKYEIGRCNSDAERKYIVETAKATDDMMSCYANGGVIPTDPPATDPPATDPPATDPPATDPPATDPPATDPTATDPPATDPPATDPPATDPPATDPPATNPPATDPPATDPPATDPPATDPPATDPPATDPPATDPPATDPPATDPPATDPPATEPPATDPPATDPPATDPPATDPPATDPPATDPPATDPPATNPPETDPPAPSSSESDERDQVEELEDSKVRTRLENFMKNWGRRV
ncbi:formin-like protein 1 isoform X2 [Episyrphus balteatus]|uniref:formin-like protein 1 isoform X2 n=1 Tax=Episyrphus balteatus TaxID=286459 RepID=UPI002485CD95|nr:formin-like protein 1 isoform X2 [Episyrphus balteatus]